MNSILNWIILDNILFGYDEDLKNKINNSNIKKIILFDLDYTLIKTKSGKTFPIDKNDWDYLIDIVPLTITQYINNNSICGIISNQKGLKNKELINNWIDKMNNINKKLGLHFVFVSLKDDNFRKPLPSSWDYIKNNYLNFIDCDQIRKKLKIYYVGDAFGRRNDFSDTDYKFAINCKFKFKTPELFFKFNLNNNSVNGTITYPIINYWKIDEQNTFLQNIYDLIETNDKILILLIGFPASGKSFIRKEIIKKYYSFYYINNDDLQNKIHDPHLILTNKNLQNYNNIIEDNTNLNIDNRKKILNNFDSFLKIGIWFDYDQDVIKHLNYMRMFWFGSKLINPIIYKTLNKSFNKPTLSEGFDKLFIISKVFENFNFSDKIQYYF